MAKLPYSRVVNVTLSRKDRFAAKRGFGTPLFLTSVAKTGKVDATNLTKVYGSIDEVAADWATNDAFYIAASAAFGQNPRPLQIKAAYYDASTVISAATMKTALNAIYEFDPDWYWLGIEAALRDTVMVDGAIEWLDSRAKFGHFESNAAGTESSANTTVTAAKNKGTHERAAVFYSTKTAEYPAFALSAALGTFNFDDADSAYTAKFKKLIGITSEDKGSAVVQAVTGFTPAIGQATATGHCANMYVNIGGQDFVVEGSTLTPNVFIDEIHASDWIIARTEEEMLGVLLNNARVPFDNSGMEMLASAARTVMRQAERAGLIAQDLDENGDYAPAVTITVPSVFDVPASQRNARIAPAIAVTFRYAGAVHYTTVNYTMTF